MHSMAKTHGERPVALWVVASSVEVPSSVGMSRIQSPARRLGTPRATQAARQPTIVEMTPTTKGAAAKPRLPTMPLTARALPRRRTERVISAIPAG